MRIEKISVENYRLFEARAFSFHPHFNLIVGENGKGKTSLLDLLALGISAWIENIGPPIESDMPILTYPVTSKEIRRATTNDFRCFLSNESGEARVEFADYLWIASDWDGIPTGTGEFVSSKWYLKSIGDPTRPSPNRPNEHVDDIDTPEHEKNFRDNGFDGPTFAPLLRQGKEILLPLFAFYGCNRLFKHSNNNQKLIQQAMEVSYQRRNGYTDWWQASANAHELMVWIQKLDIIAYQEKQVPLGLDIVQAALRECLEDFDELQFMAKEAQLMVKFRERPPLPFWQLSDGQRTLLAMISDIVRRAVILNPQLGEKILEETTGIVLIDELDLHLHPKWQRRIIEDLRRTFPKIQFICTTHSPQLIGEVKPDEIILLRDGQQIQESQSFGMDSNWILKHIMGSSDRNVDVAKELDAIFEWIEEDKFDEAREHIDALRAEIGEHPSLVRAETIIDRYTRIGE